MLYALVLIDPELCDEHYEESFFIGIFRSEQEAKEVAELYLKEVPGFCEYPCRYRIAERETEQDFDGQKQENVWIVSGWNVNEHGDEIDLIESQCYSSEERAAMILQEMQDRHPRAEWSLDRYKIGELHWRDGFFRAEHGE